MCAHKMVAAVPSYCLFSAHSVWWKFCPQVQSHANPFLIGLFRDAFRERGLKDLTIDKVERTALVRIYVTD